MLTNLETTFDVFTKTLKNMFHRNGIFISDDYNWIHKTRGLAKVFYRLYFIPSDINGVVRKTYVTKA